MDYVFHARFEAHFFVKLVGVAGDGDDVWDWEGIKL